MRFVYGATWELWTWLGAVLACKVCGHRWVWVQRSVGMRCYCERCGANPP